MQLIKIKPAPSTATPKKGKAGTLNAQFERHWRLVQKSQQDNAKLADDMAKLKQRYEAEVLPVELMLSELMAQECFRLLDFLERKTFSGYERESLVHWLGENVEYLQSHPYYPAADKAKISTVFADFLQNHQDKEDAKEEAKEEARAAKKSRRAGNNQQHNLDDDDELDDLDSRFEVDSGDDAEKRRSFDEFFNQFFAEDERQQSSDEFDPERTRAATKPDDLVRPDSINTLFRRLAKALHPDKELDESRKEAKHLLMSQLLKARENHDLPTLLLMHRQYVSEEPLAIDEKELKGLVAMLKQQLQQLEMDREQILHQDPVNFTVYRWYHGNTDKQIASNLEKHVQSLKILMQDCKQFLDKVSTVSELRRFLKQW